MVIEYTLLGCALYLGIGVLFAIPFAWRGAGRIDPHARHATWGFRCLIVPGSALLWPLLLARWLHSSGELPIEMTTHRRAAREQERQ